MDHDKAKDLFSPYLDGEVAPESRRDLEQHLAICIQCRTELESLRRTVGGLGRLKQAAPETFLPAIKQQIFVRSRGRFFGPRWKLFGRIPFEWISLAMIIAMLLYYIFLLRRSPTGVKPASYRTEQHLQVLAFGEAGGKRMVWAGPVTFEHADFPTGLLRARGDDPLELGFVDVL